MFWSRAFDDFIPLPRGRHLITLKDAANYIQILPKAEQHLDEWQAAVEALLLVVELDGPTTMAPSASIETARFGRARVNRLRNLNHGPLGLVPDYQGAHSSTFSR